MVYYTESAITKLMWIGFFLLLYYHQHHPGQFMITPKVVGLKIIPLVIIYGPIVKL